MRRDLGSQRAGSAGNNTTVWSVTAAPRAFVTAPLRVAVLSVNVRRPFVTSSLPSIRRWWSAASRPPNVAEASVQPSGSPVTFTRYMPGSTLLVVNWPVAVGVMCNDAISQSVAEGTGTRDTRARAGTNDAGRPSTSMDPATVTPRRIGSVT